MKINLKIKKSIFNKAYLPYLESKERINVFYGGAGSGKSVFVVQKMLYKYLNSNKKRKCLVVRKISRTLRDSIFSEFVNQLENVFKIKDYCDIKESRLTIKLPNGSLFLFKGIDDPEKIKSIQGIDDIIIEEASDLTLNDFTQLNLRLRSKAALQQIHLMFNPVSKANWTYKNFFKGAALEDVLVVHTTWKDNKFLPVEYIKELLKMKQSNPAYYKIYAEGKFATLDKLIYTNWRIEDFNHVELIQKNKKLKPRFGLDFGYTNDPTAFIASLVDHENRKIYIYDEHYETGMLNNHIADMIIKKGYSKEKIVADSSEPKSIAEIKGFGVRKIKGTKKGKGSVNNGIQKIQQYEIIVHPSCINVIFELENYTWKKDKQTNEYINEPVDKFDHLCDALRYALEDIKEAFNRKNYSGKGARTKK